MLGFKAVFPEICILTCSQNTVHLYTKNCLFVCIDMYMLEEGACKRGAQFAFWNTNSSLEFLSQIKSVLVLTVGSGLLIKGHSSSAYLAVALEMFFTGLSSN